MEQSRIITFRKMEFYIQYLWPDFTYIGNFIVILASRLRIAFPSQFQRDE